MMRLCARSLPSLFITVYLLLLVTARNNPIANLQSYFSLQDTLDPHPRTENMAEHDGFRTVAYFVNWVIAHPPS
jgi:hypothetical protein